MAEPKPPKRPQVGKPNTMGMRKHYIAGGRADKSPKLRHALKREAEQHERKRKKAGPLYANPTEALKRFKPI